MISPGPTRISTNMLRRSLRLQLSGYTKEGLPYISYKEVIYRVFRRRRFHNRRHMNAINNGISSQDSIASYDPLDEYQDVTDDEESTRASWTWTPDEHTTKTKASFRPTCSTVINATFLLLVLLGFGIMTYMIMQLREEVQSLRQQMKVIPLSDTMPNFALESQGAKVLHSLSSDTYLHWKPIWNIMDRLNHWLYSSISQRHVIQGHSPLQSGRCWCFPGDRGHVVVSLSHPIFITHVTISHITKSLSPYGNIASAPREFTLYGMRREDENVYLGRLVYDEDGPAIQTFEVPYQDKGVFHHVKLQVDNNWGNPDYTCLYNFRVHGQPPI